MKRKERRERRQYQWDKKGVGKRKVDKIEKGWWGKVSVEEEGMGGGIKDKGRGEKGKGKEVNGVN